MHISSATTPLIHFHNNLFPVFNAPDSTTYYDVYFTLIDSSSLANVFLTTPPLGARGRIILLIVAPI
jgi:hypothetical protein